MKQIKTITTENYILRGIKLNDAEALFNFMSDKGTMKFITPHPVKSRREMEQKVSTSLKNFELNKEIPWVILPKKSVEIIGMFRFHKLNEYHQKVEMGAVIKKAYQQKGVMSEVFQKMVPYGFNELRLNRIVGDIFEGNTGSQKLLEKFGFTKEGVLRETDFDGQRFHDTVVYSMLKREYEERKNLFSPC